MIRTVRPAMLALLAMAACQPQLHVEPPEVVAFEGVRTHVHVEAVLGCPDVEDPVLEPIRAASEPFALEVHRVRTPGDGGDYFIGNPGMDQPIHVPGDPKPGPVPVVPAPEPESYAYRDAAERDTREFDLLLQPPAGAGPGEHRLRVRARGCGTEASAELLVMVAGALELGGFCGITTGATCGAGGGCARAGCGELCAGVAVETAASGEPTLAPQTTAAHCFHSACTDPVPSGATCGCVMGACAWRLP